MARDCAMNSICPQHARPCPRPAPAHRARVWCRRTALPAGTSRRDRLDAICPARARSRIRASRAAAVCGVSPSGSVEISTTRVTRVRRPADHVQRDGAAQPVPCQRKARRELPRARIGDMSSTSAPCRRHHRHRPATATMRRSDGRRLRASQARPGIRTSGSLIRQTSARQPRRSRSASRQAGVEKR